LSSRRSGFTLLELLLVLLVLAFFIGLALAAFSGGQARRDLDHSAARLVSSLKWARERAILTGRRHRLVVAEDGDSAWLEDEADPLDEPGVFAPSEGPWGRASGFEKILEGEARVAEVALDLDPDPAEEAEEEKGLAYFYFEPRGSSRDGRIVLVAGEEDEELVRYVRVRSLTGKARVVEGEEDVDEEEDAEPEVVWTLAGVFR
ncbi:MAG: GspH/FimT family pseudopilin, partial [Planctomycetes bacterium]|nr:GspH/FimT family pseudopilin [Planctomycetota bacterium]